MHRVYAVAKIYMHGDLEGFQELLVSRPCLPGYNTSTLVAHKAKCTCSVVCLTWLWWPARFPFRFQPSPQQLPQELPSWAERSSHFTIINVINYVGASTTGTRPSPLSWVLLLCYCLLHYCVLLASCSSH